MSWFGYADAKELEKSKKDLVTSKAESELQVAKLNEEIALIKLAEQTTQNKYERLENQLQKERNEAKSKQEQLQKQINDLNLSIRNVMTESMDREAKSLKECNERWQSEKKLLMEQHREQINLIKEVKDAQNEQVAELYKNHISIRNQEIENLHKDLKDLHQQFNSSKDSFVTYFKQKPQNDIQLPEHLRTAMENAKKYLKLDTKNYYNIAFVGHTNTGKSSLINAIRGIKDGETGAALVGTTEITHFIEPYDFTDPDLKHIKIYDVPGSGTLTHDAESYYNDKHLCAFDCLFIVTQDALGSDEINFALQSLKYNQPLALVRSRFDVTMDNEKKAERISAINQHTIRDEIRKSAEAFAEQLKKTGKKELKQIPVFFVSSHSLRKLMQGIQPEQIYHEKLLLEYVKSTSKFSRNIVER